ncbi:hypothetical protein OKW09_002264 [Pseudomonas rhodesiae]|nr:hypothetical protein [Pseudomonas rhodesiae]MDF9769979.1 hypothetical protein [Pseudomonas rhodesiae]
MLGEGPIVTEITGLFCHINEPLGLPLERILYLLMAAVSKGVEFLAGVARVYRVVGTMGMDRQGAGANIAYVLRINDTAYGSFRSCIAALDDSAREKFEHTGQHDLTLPP